MYIRMYLGWIELKTPEGKMYYQNSITKTTQWNRPGPPEPATPKVAVIDNSSPSPVAGGAAGDVTELFFLKTCFL